MEHTQKSLLKKQSHPGWGLVVDAVTCNPLWDPSGLLWGEIPQTLAFLGIASAGRVILPTASLLPRAATSDD